MLGRLVSLLCLVCLSGVVKLLDLQAIETLCGRVSALPFIVDSVTSSAVELLTCFFSLSELKFV